MKKIEGKDLSYLVVVKRSGQRVPFNETKIAIAIKKGFDAVCEDNNENKIYKVFEKVLQYINNEYSERKTINVEDIQDIIEKVLKEEKYDEVYKAFKEYRERRATSRKIYSEKQIHKFSKAVIKIEDELNKKDSNIQPETFINKYGKIIALEYANSYILDNKFIRANDEGCIYIHNIDSLLLGTIPFIHLKLTDFINNSLESMIFAIINAQKEVSDEIGINSLDILLEQNIMNRYRNKLIRCVKEYFELYGLLDYINMRKIEDIISKTNDIDSSLKELLEYASNDQVRNIIKAAYKNSLDYIDNQVEITINRLLDVIRSEQKDFYYSISISFKNNNVCKKIRNAIIDYINNNEILDNISFIFKIKPNLERDYLTRISELIINKKNIYLSFINNSYNIGKNEVEYFHNGLRIYENVNDNESLSNGRMVVVRTSLNMARIGYKNKGKDIKKIYNAIDQALDYAKSELLFHFETLGNKNKENYCYLFNGNIYGDERLEENQKIRKIIKSGSLGIGLIGLKDFILNLEDEPEKQYKLLINVLNYLNKKCQIFSEETKLNFSLFEPSEERPRKKLMGLDKSIFGINNQNVYELISSASFIKNNKEKAEIQKLIKGGCLIPIILNKNIRTNSVVELIEKLIDDDVGFVKIGVNK